MKKSVLIIGLCLFVSSLQAASLETLEQRHSYAFGTRLAKMLTAQGADSVDADALAAGIADVVNGKDLQMTPDEMTQAMAEVGERKKAAKEAAKTENLKKGEAFLAVNAKKDGVKSLDNGMQYQIIKAGDGAIPAVTDKVKVHYRGTLINGTEFDSSYKRGAPATFSLRGVISGFREGISMMKTGAKWKLFLPSSMAYGERGTGSSIGPNETLIFEVELLEIVKDKKAAK